MDRELSELLGSERSLGIMEIRTRAAVEVSGVRVEKTLVSRRQFSASAYSHPCFTGEQLMQAETGESVQSSTEEERQQDRAERGQSEETGAGVMIHLNPIELGRWVAQRRVSLLGGYAPAQSLAELRVGRRIQVPLPPGEGGPQ